MKTSKYVLLVALTSVTVIAAQVHAETYGEEAPDIERHTSSAIKTLHRPGMQKAAEPLASASGLSSNSPAVTQTQAPVTQIWHLSTGHLVRQDLIAWGERAGWKVLWHLQRDWAIPADTDFTGDFKSAAAEVIRTLADNGVVIRGQFYDANKTLVVSGASPLTPDPQ